MWPWVAVVVVGFVVGVVGEGVRQRRAARQVADVPPAEQGPDGAAAQVPPAAGAMPDDVPSRSFTADAACAECGASLKGMAWADVVGVELTFQDSYRDEVFCSQVHAAAWLAKPLPPLDVHPLSGGDRPRPDWAWIAVVSAVLVVLGLAVVGAVWLVRLAF